MSFGSWISSFVVVKCSSTIVENCGLEMRIYCVWASFSALGPLSTRPLVVVGVVGVSLILGHVLIFLDLLLVLVAKIYAT